MGVEGMLRRVRFHGRSGIAYWIPAVRRSIVAGSQEWHKRWKRPSEGLLPAMEGEGGLERNGQRTRESSGSLALEGMRTLVNN